MWGRRGTFLIALALPLLLGARGQGNLENEVEVHNTGRQMPSQFPSNQRGNNLPQYEDLEPGSQNVPQQVLLQQQQFLPQQPGQNNSQLLWQQGQGGFQSPAGVQPIAPVNNVPSQGPGFGAQGISPGISWQSQQQQPLHTTLQYQNPSPPVPQEPTLQQFSPTGAAPQSGDPVPQQVPPQYNPVPQQAIPQFSAPVPQQQTVTQYGTSTSGQEPAPQFRNPVAQQGLPQYSTSVTQYAPPQYTTTVSQQAVPQYGTSVIQQQAPPQYTQTQYTPSVSQNVAPQYTTMAQYGISTTRQIAPQYSNTAPQQTPQYNYYPQSPATSSPQSYQVPRARPAPQKTQRPRPSPSPAMTRRITAPYPGCPASMLCVPENYCNIIGLVEENPIQLSAADRSHRVALMQCSQPMTGAVGVCCRVPNYDGSWPDMSDWLHYPYYPQHFRLQQPPQGSHLDGGTRTGNTYSGDYNVSPWSFQQPPFSNFLRTSNNPLITISSARGRGTSSTPQQRALLYPSYSRPYSLSSSALTSLADLDFSDDDHVSTSVITLPTVRTRSRKPYGDTIAHVVYDVNPSTGEVFTQNRMASKGAISSSYYYSPRQAWWGQTKK